MNISYWSKRKNSWTCEVHPKQRLTQVYKFSSTQIILGCLGIGEDSIIIHIQNHIYFPSKLVLDIRECEKLSRPQTWIFLIEWLFRPYCLCFSSYTSEKATIVLPKYGAEKMVQSSNFLSNSKTSTVAVLALISTAMIKMILCLSCLLQ